MKIEEKLDMISATNREISEMSDLEKIIIWVKRAEIEKIILEAFEDGKEYQELKDLLNEGELTDYTSQIRYSELYNKYIKTIK